MIRKQFKNTNKAEQAKTFYNLKIFIRLQRLLNYANVDEFNIV